MRIPFTPAMNAFGPIIVNASMPVEQLPAALVISENVVMRDLAPLFFSIVIGCHGDCDVDLVSDLCCGVAYCQALTAHHLLCKTFPFVGEIELEFRARLASLLNGDLDPDRKHLLGTALWDASATRGNLHSLALRIYMEMTSQKPDRILPLQSVGTLASTQHVMAVVPLMKADEQTLVSGVMIDWMLQRQHEDVRAVLG